MGKPTGFMEYKRVTGECVKPIERIKHFKEFHPLLPIEKQQIQGARCMDCGIPFCQSGIELNGATSGCPLNNLIPEWNDAIFNSNWDEAIKRLLLTNNFPEFTGRVCPAPCEAACTCGLNEDPVSIKENELSIIEYAFKKHIIKPIKPSVRTSKKIAVIGSGPAGLAAAAQLNSRGHSVTVYERDDRLGGLLMYGIPNMKLDKKIIDRRINIMKEEGVEFVVNANIGKTIDAEDILSSYDAVILACGSSNPRDINVTGRDAKGIYFAVDFLKETTKSLLNSNLQDNKYISAENKNIIVVGGGDTGNDCVGTSNRHGCKSVVQLEIMPKPPEKRTEYNPWPEWPKVCKTDYGQEEAIAVFGNDPRMYETTIKEFIKNEKDELVAVKIVKVKFVKDEETGRMNLQEVEGSEKIIDADIVLIAAGFLGTENYIAESFGVSLNARTNVSTECNSYKTTVNKVFTAGDMHRGQSLVVWAIAEGREAARVVDKFLMGYSNLR